MLLVLVCSPDTDPISLAGWLEEDERLAGKLNHGTFTTGRTRPQQAGKKAEFSPRSPVQSVVPGKLNLAAGPSTSSPPSALPPSNPASAPNALIPVKVIFLVLYENRHYPIFSR